MQNTTVNESNEFTAPEIHQEPGCGHKQEGRPAVSCALFLCVESLEAHNYRNNSDTNSSNNNNNNISAGTFFQLPPSVHANRFRHTHRRAALHKGKAFGDPEEAEEDGEKTGQGEGGHGGETASLGDSPQKWAVDLKVERARQRRAKHLQAKHLQPSQPEGRRQKVEALVHEHQELVAAQLTAKMALAAQRREQMQQERLVARSVAEKVRTERLAQVRHRRCVALILYSAKVAPMLEVFRQSGLSLQGARTTAAVERVLMQDTFAPCAACCPLPSDTGSAPHSPTVGSPPFSSQAGFCPQTATCPTTGKRHSKRLVALAEGFLSQTGELRQILHSERSKRCTEQDTAKAEGTALHLSDDSSCDVTTPSAKEGTQEGKHAASGCSTSKDPVGLPHFLPLAFHEACGSRADQGEQKLFAARNVVLLLEEIHAATTSVAHDYQLVQLTFTEDEDEDGVTTIPGVSVIPTPTAASVEHLLFQTTSTPHQQQQEDYLQKLSAKCEHLRHALSRFVKSWKQFSTGMRLEQHQRQADQGQAQQRRMGEQMIASYLQLTQTQYWRTEDVNRRQELIDSGSCPSPALKHRQKWVAERREELTSAIQMQLNDLHRGITGLGLVAELEEQLGKVQYSGTSSASGTSCTTVRGHDTTPTVSSTMMHQHKQQPPQEGSGASGSCGLSSEGGKVTRQGKLPHVNSADWCGDLSSETDHTPERQIACPVSRRQLSPRQKNQRLSPTPTANTSNRTTTSSRSSVSFRAQLATDRQRLRAQHKADKAAEDHQMAGNDGDADEA